jgi:hypothetical protein
MKNLTGQKFNKLTALKFVGRNKIHAALWECQCDCGNKTIVVMSELTLGRTKSCGCLKRGPKRTDIIGKKFGRLLVQSVKGLDKRKEYEYNCLCDCGNVKTVVCSSLERGVVKSCGCLKKECASKRTGFEQISGSYWGAVKRAAALRNIDFNITVEYAWDLFISQQRQCALSGEQLGFVQNYSRDKRRIQTASLDRINSDIGYEAGNVQWVHKDINLMKLDHSQKEFIEWCRKVANNYGG